LYAIGRAEQSAIQRDLCGLVFGVERQEQSLGEISMSRGYEYAASLDRKITGHLKSLGFNIDKPPVRMTIARKLDVLNYLRSFESTSTLLQKVVREVSLEVELESGDD